MANIPEILKQGLPACIIWDDDTPEQVIAKIEDSVYAVDGRTKARERLPEFYERCKRETEKKPTVVQRHKFF